MLEAYLDALIEAECIQIVGDEFPKLLLTPLGQAVMRRQRIIPVALPGATMPMSPRVDPLARAPVSPGATSSPAVLPTTDVVCDDTLLERLRTERTILARAVSLPPYCIFNDRTLREMAMHLPTSQARLLQMYGVGTAKASKYGEMFLTLIRDYLAEDERRAGACHT